MLLCMFIILLLCLMTLYVTNW